ncbi:hypothetical protein [Psychrosphaera algicola]|uniref:Uncharacterized protein n=1 Tax=Psychrosphaera algicola TaxID=3023714 RepID=A0ABT5F8A2_9GAMM|nr:hypothetical protein [Psychrosphaera sp. G1-22]MDC2887757.1 hypothetical protein [Psychrosphaera sp. G1-22]
MAQRKLAMALQFCVPGSPNLYYGSELGMIGEMIQKCERRCAGIK